MLTNALCFVIVHNYRTIEFSAPSSELMVTHGDFDNSDINKDVNAMFPILSWVAEMWKNLAARQDRKLHGS